jgi:pyrroloquinoline-quinone synthase
MKQAAIWSKIESIIAQHDLLQHPFYQAWTAGTLRREDLRRYAMDYYHHVSAFPTYLSALHSRLPDGALRRTVLQNLSEEEIAGVAHSDLWLDFAEGMGAPRERVSQSAPSASMQALIRTFRGIVADRAPLAALGAFYAYESQVARIASAKAQGLLKHYSADARTCGYFTLHATQDVHHARVWAEQIDELFGRQGASAVEELLSTVEDAARALWASLDGIHQPASAVAAVN